MKERISSEEQEIKNLMSELNNVKERLSQEIMKNVELEKEKADLIIATTSACNKYDKLNIELQALQKLIDDFGDELPELKCIQCNGSGAYNNNDSCGGIESVQCQFCDEIRFPFLNETKMIFTKLKQERDKAYKKLDNDTMAVLGFQIKIIKLKKELKETIEENEELRGNSCG